MNTDIHWPALLSYAGDPELIAVMSAAEWRQDYLAQYYDAADLLIDSAGQCFHLKRGSEPQHSDTQLSLDALNDLLRLHFAAAGACCVAKMLVGSVAEAVQVVASD
ncbi:DUF4144 domain-containing protein [Aliamphritea ceti]|uniref:DUF4144 domain-containing protein n=1 Tax=Aliamphritea ceti TaxID=1524258 RepID=UPI0021C3C21A|nr:DUF4144 domain-containing protein [Aliamphritea ceti]